MTYSGPSVLEPYRSLVAHMLTKVKTSFDDVNQRLIRGDKKVSRPAEDTVYTRKVDLMNDVKLCYDSLVQTGVM